MEETAKKIKVLTDSDLETVRGGGYGSVTRRCKVCGGFTIGDFPYELKCHCDETNSGTPTPRY